MALTRPFDEWPLLICGPMLRRVTDSEVAVFAATKEPCDVQLVIGAKGSGVPAWASDVVRTRRLGSALNVVVCHLRAPAGDPFVAGVNYEYDLRMTPPDTGITQTLADQPGLLTGPVPLGFALNALPSFAMAPGLPQLNLIHGSCRKPHGGGRDALATVDLLIDRALASGAASAARRPHQLLLTGDQIYADDVALVMLATLQEAAGLLCAQSPEERFPGGVVMTVPDVAPGTARETFVATRTTLSSDKAMNHLLFLGEFCAMYVMCWSDELWPRDAQGTLELGDMTVDPVLEATNLEERMNLRAFLGTVRRARRALANVPTMMAFDDHEISDDWNLDRFWFDSSRTDPGQKRVVRNGLLAFAVFQAWGNDPGRYTTGVPASLLGAVSVPDGDTVSPVVRTPDLVDAALDLTTASGERMTWNWTLPGQGHLVIALDTRTRRDYASAGPLRAGLLTTQEFVRQLSTHRPQTSSDTRLRIVVAPAPVVGHPFVEATLQPLWRLWKNRVTKSRIKGGRAADFEAWSVNRVTYQEMLRRLADFGRVVVLSGDVHYAYSNHTAYFGAQGQPPARIVQLCASAAKNSDEMTRAVQDYRLIDKEGEAWLGLGTPLAANLPALLLGALGPLSPLPLRPLDNLLYRALLFEFFRTPATVPLRAWSLPNAQLAVTALADRNDPRDWRYVTKFAFDDRPGPARRALAQQIDPRPVSPPAAHFVEQAHRVVVGEPNVGQVFFEHQRGLTTVVHRLHHVIDVGGIGPVQTCTEHRVPLDPPGPTERPWAGP